MLRHIYLSQFASHRSLAVRCAGGDAQSIARAVASRSQRSAFGAFLGVQVAETNQAWTGYYKNASNPLEFAKFRANRVVDVVELRVRRFLDLARSSRLSSRLRSLFPAAPKENACSRLAVIATCRGTGTYARPGKGRFSVVVVSIRSTPCQRKMRWRRSSYSRLCLPASLQVGSFEFSRLATERLEYIQ